MDTISIYTNIDISHGLYVLKQFLKLFEHKLPAKFSVKLVIATVSLVMTNNIFEFRDFFFIQLVGKAMGTPVAVMKATIYYALHKVTVLLAKYKRHFMYYGRFIDNSLGA